MLQNPDPPRKKIVYQNDPYIRPLFQNEPTLRGVTDVLDSQYDTGINPQNLQELNYNRAINQPLSHQIANATVKTIPAIGLGILENAGSLGELLFDWGEKKDYSNIFTDLARKGREKLEGSLPAYREDPNAVFDLGDTAWWINHGQGLVESIGEFLVTGVGVGGALSKGAKALTTALKAGELATKVGQAGAQLGTASSLAYVEGAMSGARIFSDVLKSTGSVKEASDAASRTVYLNTVLNTGLNLTSISPLFRTLNKLDEGIKSQLARQPKETTVNYLGRLTKLIGQEAAKPTVAGRLAFEAIQEGLEEDVNLFAEREGYIKGGLKKKTGDEFSRFFNAAFSEEGALNFILGAAGGVGQTVGMEYLPFRSYEDDKGVKRSISAIGLEAKHKQDYQKEVISTLKNDITYLNDNQKALNAAVQAGDKLGIETARNNLFNLAALKSIRNGSVDELSNELTQLAQVDNTTVGLDGLTDAQRQGLADNTQDNLYKEKALKRATDIKSLANEYQDLKSFISTPHVLDEAFRRRLNVYSLQNVVDEFSKEEITNEQRLSSLLTDPLLFEGAKLKAELSAYDVAIEYFNKNDDPTNAVLMQSERKMAEHHYKLVNESDPSIDSKVTANQGILKPLVKTYANKLVGKQRLQEVKKDYSDILDNHKAFERLIKAQADKVEKDIIDVKKKKATKKQQEKEQKDLTTATENKKSTGNKQVVVYGTLTDPKTRKESIGRDITTVATNIHDVGVLADEEYKTLYQTPGQTTPGEILELTPEELDKLDKDEKNYTRTQVKTDHGMIDAYVRKSNIDAKGQEQLSDTKVGDTTIVAPDQIDSINKTEEAYQGKQGVIKKEEEQELDELVSSYSLNDNIGKNGKHNKIAYKAQEQDESGKTVDSSFINPIYKVLHSTLFNVGTSVTLKVATESSFYEANKDNPDKVPIGIYHEGVLIGYIPTYRGEEKTLKSVRLAVIDQGSVATTISDKDFGVLNRSPNKYLSKDAFPIMPKFVIAKNGRAYINKDKEYPTSLVNSSDLRNGFVYAIVKTPNGKEIALPVDINKVSEQIADSVMTALAIYLAKETLTPEQLIVVKEVFDKYGINLQTQAGLQEYVNMFLYTSDLRDPVRITQINTENKDNYYIQVSPNGIRYIRSGGAINVNGVLQAKEVGSNTPNPAAFYEDLKKHLVNMYMRVDLNKVEDNAEFKGPLLKIDNKGALTYTEYSKETYADYIAENTNTNMVGVRISENEATYFVQPSLFFDYSFISKPPEKSKETIDEKTKQKAILATSKKTFGSLTKSLPSTKTEGTQITNDQVDDAMKHCEK